MEERQLLATITVSTTNDVVDGDVSSVTALKASHGADGKISLREAVIAADNTAADTEIDLPQGNFKLTIAPPSIGAAGESDPRGGDLDIFARKANQTWTIRGAGSDKTTISNALDKVFSFNPLFQRPIGAYEYFNVVLMGLTLTGQNTAVNTNRQDNNGGAFDLHGTYSDLTMTDVDVFQSGTSNGSGGGIALFTGGVVTITNCSFTQNFATSEDTTPASGGGIYVGYTDLGTVGMTMPTVTISNSLIDLNMTGAFSDTLGTAGNGGGLYDAGGPNTTLELHGVSIHTNTAGAVPGGQTPPPGINGGGVFVASDNLTIDQATDISNNLATGRGGGLFSRALNGTVNLSSIINNSRVDASDPTTFTSDGVFVDSGSLTMRECRIVSNGVPGTLVDLNPANQPTADAANCWFGTFGTSPPQPEQFGTGVLYMPYLVSDVTAPKTNLAVDESVQVTFAIRRNSAGLDGFTVADGSPVLFGAFHGTVNPTTAMTVNGSATTTFTPAAGFVGQAFAGGSLDGGGFTLVFQVGNPQLAPMVTLHPQSQTIGVGQTVTFTAGASGNPTPTVQWQVSTNFGQTFSNISGATDSSYSFTVAPADNNKMFRAVFTNSLGTATTGNALLTVALATITGVSITRGPTGQLVPLLTQSGGVRVLPSGRNRDVPWLGIDVIRIGLSDLVGFPASDIHVNGINVGDYGPVTISIVSFTPLTYGLKLTRPINGPDRVTIRIETPAITTFTRRLDVLPGDVNDDGVVNSQDAVIERNKVYNLNTVSIPALFLDIDGDGLIDVNDFNLVRQRNGKKLP